MRGISPDPGSNLRHEATINYSSEITRQILVPPACCERTVSPYRVNFVHLILISCDSSKIYLASRKKREKNVSLSLARAYSIPNGNKLRGRPKTTFSIVFNKDLAQIQHPIRLHSSKDLAEITELAQDRKCWRGLTPRTKKAAEVSKTKNWDAKRQ